MYLPLCTIYCYYIENDYIFLWVYKAIAALVALAAADVVVADFIFHSTKKAKLKFFWAQLNKLSFEFKETT